MSTRYTINGRMPASDVTNLVSIVVPAFNEEQRIFSCLSSIANQSTTRRYEVIVVNNNSTDNTVLIANDFTTTLTLRVITESKKGRGSARRTGFDAAYGIIILSTDADASVPHYWVENLLSRFDDDSSIVAVTGPCKITDSTPLRNALFNLIQPVSMRLYKVLFGHYWLSGFNFAIKRDVYLKVGGFDSRLNAQEDIDLSFKVNRIGKIMYVANASVVVSGRRFQKGLISGLLPYIRTFVSHFLFRRSTIFLDDVR